MNVELVEGRQCTFCGETDNYHGVSIIVMYSKNPREEPTDRSQSMVFCVSCLANMHSGSSAHYTLARGILIDARSLLTQYGDTNSLNLGNLVICRNRRNRRSRGDNIRVYLADTSEKVVDWEPADNGGKFEKIGNIESLAKAKSEIDRWLVLDRLSEVDDSEVVL